MKISGSINVDPNSRMMKFAEKLNPSLKERNNVNLTIEALDSRSMTSIRKELLGVVDVFFVIAHAIFFNFRKVIYVSSLLLMIYDTYRYFGQQNIYSLGLGK